MSKISIAHSGYNQFKKQKNSASLLSEKESSSKKEFPQHRSKIQQDLLSLSDEYLQKRREELQTEKRKEKIMVS